MERISNSSFQHVWLHFSTIDEPLNNKNKLDTFPLLMIVFDNWKDQLHEPVAFLLNLKPNSPLEGHTPFLSPVKIRPNTLSSPPYSKSLTKTLTTEDAPICKGQILQTCTHIFCCSAPHGWCHLKLDSYLSNYASFIRHF